MANERLTVKNFGPIREADLDLRKVTVLIGEQASGKSVLAKVLSIVNSRKPLTAFKSNFGNLNYTLSSLSWDLLSEYSSSNSEIIFEGIDVNIYLDWSSNKSSRTITGKKLKKIIDDLEFARRKGHLIYVEEENIFETKQFERLLEIKAEKEENREETKMLWEQMLQLTFESVYIPAERILVLLSDSETFGTHFLNSFAKEFREKRRLLDKFPILSNKFEYYYNNNIKKNIFIERGKEFGIESAASGLQSLVPLKTIIEANKIGFKNLFIVEEPEQNLYPTAQKEIVEYLIEKCTQGDNRLIITTHSPYILTALNNCIEASNVRKLHPESEAEVDKLVPRQYQIDYEDVMAYFVADGTAKPIMNEEYRIIDANALDDVSNELGRVFDSLLDLKYQNRD